jgi:glucan phosphorylase
MGFFSSDRAIDDYARNIWDLQPVTVTPRAST